MITVEQADNEKRLWRDKHRLLRKAKGILDSEHLPAGSLHRKSVNIS
jgi:hypothetical protein